MLLELEEYKQVAQISSPNQDNRLEIILELVSEFVEEYCGRKFLEGQYTQYFTAENCEIYVPNLPIVDVESLEYYSNTATPEWVALTKDEDFFVEDEAGMVELVGSVSTYPIKKPFRLTYIGGYSCTPPTLKLALIDLVTFYYKGEATPRKTVGSTTTTNAEFSFSHLPPHIKRVLDLYRLVIS